MIGYLDGTIKFASKGKLIIYTGGIGFTVNTPTNISFLEGQKASLYIHTHLRDDNLSLFGFATPQDLDLFELLITVSGVGPKIALSIFSQSSSENVINAIQSSNLNFFTAISGVGKKTAQRLILDLKAKVGKGDVNMSNLEGASEFVDSLVSLGFQRSEVAAIISQVDMSGSLSDQVKSALKLLRK
jgi:Holliday junction DNA helicase RuvA